jgi:hypothetical protein
MSFDLVPRQEGEGGGAGAGGPWGPISLSPEFIAEDRSSQIVIIHSVLFSVAFAVVLLRIYVRIFLLRAFSIDDYIMVAATVGSTRRCRPDCIHIRSPLSCFHALRRHGTQD